MPGKRAKFYRLAANAIIKRLGLSKDEVAAIGMTKLAVTSSARPDIGKKALLDLCEGRTVATLKAKLNGTPASVRQVIFPLNVKQRAALNRALEKFGEVEDGRVAALMKIIDKVG